MTRISRFSDSFMTVSTTNVEVAKKLISVSARTVRDGQKYRMYISDQFIPAIKQAKQLDR